jgi:16S rRNA (cytosine1402-N4)-methyltransferase
MKKNSSKIDNSKFHKSVLLNEVIMHLAPKNGETYLDATFGAGGYSLAILESAKCHVYGVDRDESAKKFAAQLEKKFPKNFTFLSGKFSESQSLLAEKGVEQVDAMIFDLGVSSMQFDEMERGFSFDSEAKLDMRMDQKNPFSAFEAVNEMKEEDLRKIIKEFGEEPKAKLIAKKIVQERKIKPITSCKELADIVRSLYYGYSKTDPATRTFQAFRIFVNQELEELKRALEASISLLKVGGRLIVVSFHSLEDSIVKSFLKKEAGLDQERSRYVPLNLDAAKVNFRILSKSAIQPSVEELKENNRARSSKMRVAVRV